MIKGSHFRLPCLAQVWPSLWILAELPLVELILREPILTQDVRCCRSLGGAYEDSFEAGHT